MKTFLKVLFLLLLFVAPYDTVGQKEIATDYHITIIKAEPAPAASSQHTGKSNSFAGHQKAEEGANTFNASSYLDTLVDSRDDSSVEAFAKASVQRHTLIFLNSTKATETGIPTEKLIFPFHFFL